jgi:uncharacterized membrane-anchored protein
MKTMLNKVPAVTIIFWLIKTLATTVGETAADYLNTTLKFGLVATSGVMAVLLLIALAVQLWTRRYIPAVYWLVVVLISVVGTLISDNLVDNLGVSLAVSSTIFAAALAVVFGVWYAIERTLSVHTITTTKRELFYWAAILFILPRHLGRRLGRREAWPRLRVVRGSVPLADRRGLRRMALPEDRRRAGVLGGLYPDPPARRLDR